MPVERLLAGDVAAFERAYDEHAPAVYAAAYRVLGDAARAQDVAQDVFLSLWRNPARFDPARGELGSYLRLMARSRALDIWREAQVAGRASQRLRLLASVYGEPAEERPGAALERSDDRRRVRSALMRLPDPQRQAILMAYWGQLTADQIAQRVEAPLGTIKSRIRLGLMRLREECAAELADAQPLAA